MHRAILRMLSQVRAMGGAVLNSCVRLWREVTFFINTIANVLYTCVDHWHGVPSTNYGDSFLMVWKPRKNKDKDGMVPRSAGPAAGLP